MNYYNELCYESRIIFKLTIIYGMCMTQHAIKILMYKQQQQQQQQ
jgi:hypothetical protein